MTIEETRAADGAMTEQTVAIDADTDPADGAFAMETEGLDVYYGRFRAVKDVTLSFRDRQITALIGPSGCGKSTLLRTLNRMNDLVPTARVEGEVRFHGQNIFEEAVDPVELRRRVGMVFQKPNPFPKSIYQNVAWGARINGMKDGIDDLVEQSLRRATLWDEVRDKLDESGYSLSGGQQQRLCIARAIAVKPEIILMDEPTSALDPVATLRIEELIQELKVNYTIIIVTHNMQQAARASDHTVFLNMDRDRAGYVVESGSTNTLFTNPSKAETEDYITGRFG